MITYRSINLKDILENEQLGENAANQILSQFSCPLDLDVDYFIKHSAIEFAKQGISSTYLVVASLNDKHILVGYFTIANKVLFFNQQLVPSKSWQKHLLKFSQFDKLSQRHTLAALLIGQLGKNYSNSCNTLIDGSVLLQLALDKIKEIQRLSSGKIVFLECKNNAKLIDFYSRNSFVNFGIRNPENQAKSHLHKTPLVLMLKYLR